MTTVCQSFTVSDFNAIMLQSQYTLPVDISDIINSLDKIIGQYAIESASEMESSAANNNIKRPDRFGDNRSNNKLNSNSPSPRNGRLSKSGARTKNNSSGQLWDAARNFKTTKLETKEGVEKQINEIRIMLNKISVKNYDTQKDEIIQKMTDFLELDDTQEECEENGTIYGETHRRIATVIFDIASTNKFFSELYAKLYKALIEKFDVFRDILDGFVIRYIESVHQIHSVDPNTDYDGFCNYTKTNDTRKATASFIVNLMKNNILSQDIVINIIMELQKILFRYIDEDNRTNEVDEITENVFLYVSHGKTELRTHTIWLDIIIPSLTKLSQMKAKEHKSLSSRAVFKYMDILDNLKK